MMYDKELQEIQIRSNEFVKISKTFGPLIFDDIRVIATIKGTWIVERQRQDDTWERMIEFDGDTWE